MLWKILILTLRCRTHFLNNLMAQLGPQLIPGVVGTMVFEDDGEQPRGAKRQRAIESSAADFVSFIDDDDSIPDDHCRRILDVIASDSPPDIVGFRLRYFLDGIHAGEAIHSYDRTIPFSPMPEPMVRMPRLPNHLNPVRREMAMRAGYPVNRDSREDSDYAHRLANLSPRETFVDAHLYDYFKRSDTRGETSFETRKMADYLERRAKSAVHVLR